MKIMAKPEFFDYVIYDGENLEQIKDFCKKGGARLVKRVNAMTVEDDFGYSDLQIGDYVVFNKRNGVASVAPEEIKEQWMIVGNIDDKFFQDLMEISV